MLYPLLGVIAVSCVVAIDLIVTGTPPNPILLANLYAIGTGTGLILARIGRLGPFGGVLGMPWFESRLDETLAREAARAMRFERDLTIAAVRQTSEPKIDWRDHARATDQVIVCRDGWMILILPETDLASALILLRRVRAVENVDFHAALVNPDPDRPRALLGAELAALIRQSTLPGSIAVGRRGAAEHLSLAG